jgi:hypothetical protein
LVPRTSVLDSSFWPTPEVPNGGRGVPVGATVTGNTVYARSGRKIQIGLHLAVKLWPTPTVSDTCHRKTKYAQGGTPLSMAAGGQLSPRWVEWLMGFPDGWTDLEDSATR